MEKVPGLTLVLLIFAIIAVIPVSGGDFGTITIDQLLHMDAPGPFSLSPDGNYIVYLRADGTDLSPEFTNNTLMFIDLRSGACCFR